MFKYLTILLSFSTINNTSTSKLIMNLISNQALNENISFIYKDLNTNFIISYNVNKTYYAASTIKILPVLYLYTNNEDLTKEITYLKKHYNQYSTYNYKYHYHDLLTLNELIKDSLLISDNTAYLMLFDYIGKDNLINLQKKLNINNLLDKDKYGYINCEDLTKYLTYYYELTKYKDLRNVTNYLINSFHNYLNVNGKLAATKYGLYHNYFHNFGIIYDKNPYILIILTNQGINKGIKTIKIISREINKIHNYYVNKYIN